MSLAPCGFVEPSLQADLPRIAQNARQQSHRRSHHGGRRFAPIPSIARRSASRGPAGATLMLLHGSTGHFVPLIDETGTSTQYGDLFGAAEDRAHRCAWRVHFLPPDTGAERHGIVAIGGPIIWPSSPRRGHCRAFFADHGPLAGHRAFQGLDTGWHGPRSSCSWNCRDIAKSDCGSRASFTASRSPAEQDAGRSAVPPSPDVGSTASPACRRH